MASSRSDATMRSSEETWQARKGAMTRARIVDATIDCIVEFGYHKTTMARVAERANASQGAMQHHFASKLELIKAAINRLQEQRLTERGRDLAERPYGVDTLAYGIEVYWDHVSRKQFTAYQELVMAARTDPELAAVLKPAYQKFIAQYRDDSAAEVPEWQANRNDFELVADLLQHLMEGLAYGQLNDQLDDARTREVIGFASELIAAWTDRHFV